MKLNLVVSALLVGYSAGQPTGTIVDVAAGDARFSTLVDFVVQADLAGVLGSTPGLTVFAPTNDAFTALATAAPDVVANLGEAEWSNHLEDVLKYHVLPVEVRAEAITDGLKETALNEEELTINANDGVVTVNIASEVVEADVDASNGVIHAIDNVLLPSWVSNSIVDRASGSPDLSILVDLVGAAGLAETLSGPGPFTVFAPTNDAFNEFLKGFPDGPTSEAVTSILTFHVLSGIYSAADIEDVFQDGLSVSTLQGGDVTFSTPGMVNDATIAVLDILANNGIVHVIDRVMTPPVPIPAATIAPVSCDCQDGFFNNYDSGYCDGNCEACPFGDFVVCNNLYLPEKGAADCKKQCYPDSSASGYRSTFAAATATLVGFGLAIGIAF